MIVPINADKLRLSICSLGGGNHFGEINEDDEGNHYIVIHSGSRHLGIEVCRYYQDLAIKYHHNDRTAMQDAIKRLKQAGREQEIEDTLQRMSAERPPVPNELAYLEGALMQDYLHDMRIAQDFAMWNREAMMDVIIEGLGIKRKHILDKFCTMHNYIDLDNMVLRKGAISLQKDEVAIIPMNMRDGALIVKGKGNPEWNCSGPHGAGRLMSRSKAKESLKMEDFKAAMFGIYTTCVSTSTIDESPMAYKPMNEIVANIQDTADIVKVIKPIYNFKAGE
jgi:RNA-splicing ligase RtcB